MNIEEMNIDELEDLETLLKLKEKAKHLYNLVAEKQKVDLFSERKIVWKDDHNSEYLIQKDGKWIWVAAYLHQHYEVTIDADEIYNTLKSAYFFEKSHKNTCYANHEKEAMSCFESYVNYILGK